MTPPLFSLDSVTYTYAGASEPALDGVSLRVEEGEFVVVAGRSGSGKSTLLRAASGLVPHFHGGEFSGQAAVSGRDLRDHGPGALADVVGTVLQDPETQVVMGTVRAELALPLEHRGQPPAAVARAVEETALALGIAPLLDRATHELSGGELQRVALGAALAGRPRLVVLDEPTSQLDPVAGDELVGLLRRLNEEWGVAILLAEHRLERCLGAADRVLVVADGQIACDAPPREMLAWAAGAAPELETPAAALLRAAGLGPPPDGVKRARATLRSHGLLEDGGPQPARGTAEAPAPGRRARRAARQEAVLAAEDLWCEHRGGRAVLRGISLTLQPGERVALMGRNGAGKSTLLRHLGGLDTPTRGRVRASGRVALLLQNPNDYLVHDRVDLEAGAAALERAGLTAHGARHPRDLSGGERQRLALAVVLDAEAGGERPVAVLLDEPTRGMDRADKAALAAFLDGLAADGAAILVATHDAEFAARLAARVVLLGDGVPVADGPVHDVLAGGWYFATETARVLGGAGGALLPEEGAVLLRSRLQPIRHTRPDPVGRSIQ